MINQTKMHLCISKYAFVHIICLKPLCIGLNHPGNTRLEYTQKAVDYNRSAAFFALSNLHKKLT